MKKTKKKKAVKKINNVVLQSYAKGSSFFERIGKAVVKKHRLGGR